MAPEPPKPPCDMTLCIAVEQYTIAGGTLSVPARQAYILYILYILPN